MNDPVRWRDDPEEAPAGVLDLLDAVPPISNIPVAVRRRATRRVVRLASVSTAVALWWVALKTAAAAATVGLVTVVAATTIVEQVQIPAPHSVDRPTPSASVPPPRVRSSAPAMREQPEDPATPEALPEPAVVAFPTLPSDQDVLEAEAQLVEAARVALGRDPARSLVLAHEHQRRFPRGQLGAERTLVQIEALRHLGRSAEAHALAQEFLARHPGDLYTARVRQLVESTTTKADDHQHPPTP